MNRWKTLASKIGPLRYQSSEADCVPTSVVNGLLVVMGKPISAKLLQLIWSVSIDDGEGTGYVGCSVIADILQSWFKRSHQDGKEKKSLPYSSEIIEGETVGLHRNNALARCLNGGGVACITTDKGAHYLLVLAEENSQYLMFDPTWPMDKPSRKTAAKVKENLLVGSGEDYNGLVNLIWSRERFQKEITGKHNQWMHLIHKL